MPAVNLINTGFDDPVHDAQQTFRLLLAGMSSPGEIMSLPETFGRLQPPPPFHAADYAIALTLLDHSTKAMMLFRDPDEALIASLRFHQQTRLVSKEQHADFIFCDEKCRPNLSTLNPGSELYPDRSTSLIVQCKSFDQGASIKLSGPGIEDSRIIQCSAFSDALLNERQALQSAFPLGIDLIFSSQQRFFCLPRSTRITRH